MRRQFKSLALTTPHLAKQASLLYERIALFQVKTPLGYGFSFEEEESRQFKDWCVETVTVKPDMELRDYRDPELMLVGARVLKRVLELQKVRSGYWAMLLPGSSDVDADLRADMSYKTTEEAVSPSGSQFARLLLDTVQPAATADWEQVREFRRDEVAKRDYRGIVDVHQLLEKARNRQEAADILEDLKKRSTDALIKHGFGIERPIIQLLVAGVPGSMGVLAGIFSGLPPVAIGATALTAVGGIALATCQVLEAIQARKATKAAALVMKVHGFAESLETKKKLPSRAAKRHA